MDSNLDPTQFKAIRYEPNKKDGIATIVLNRPKRFNAIADGMPQEIRYDIKSYIYHHIIA